MKRLQFGTGMTMTMTTMCTKAHRGYFRMG